LAPYSKFIIARSAIGAMALPGKYRRRNQSRVARGRKAAPNVAGTLRVPSAPLCAQPAAKRKRHTECAYYVGAFIRNSIIARTATGAGALPRNTAIEIKAA
jgi:hypothetical protein